VKGFRPGKEPTEIRKQRAKKQFGEVSASQERLIEMFAERSPEEARTLLRRWKLGLLAAGLVLAVVGGFLFLWSLAAGIVLEILAVIAMVLWWRIQGQSQTLEAMVEAVSRPGGGRSGKKGRGRR